MNGMVTLFQSAVEGSIVPSLTAKTASVRRQACLDRLAVSRVLVKVKCEVIPIIIDYCEQKGRLKKVIKTRKKDKMMLGYTYYLKEKCTFLPKLVDTLKLYAIKSYCSPLDGLSMIFKICKQNRRGYFMFRTLCIMMFKTTFLHSK